MKIRPLGDNVVIKQEEVEEKSKTGIIMSTSEEEKTLTGEVIAVGKSVEDLEAGDKVVFAPYSGKEIGGMLIIASHDIMGVIEEEECEHKWIKKAGTDWLECVNCGREKLYEPEAINR